MFFSLSFSNGMQWVTISPLANSFKINYGINTFEADLMSLSFMMVYPFITPIASSIIDNYNMRLGVNYLKFYILDFYFCFFDLCWGLY